ncbi:MAG: vitamin B12-dependent ribonucleotide reductase [Firmicutes bacterium]|jgi:ribonucleoside-diphosphate reductase alpha chain|nr:vitamin B12-dependent ribonucleotide reductase [Bacillota bacterium]
MQLSNNARTVLERRYLAKDTEGNLLETPEEMIQRVARNIAAVDANYGADAEAVAQTETEFIEIMDRLEFLPNSPTLMNAGRELQQLSACFVLPVEDSMEGIFDAVKNAALIHKSGGGTGFAFSRLRPKNDKVLSTGGIASGPISFMKVFNSATEAVKQGGTRRGANMGVLRIDHPDIMEFITCKQDSDDLTNFNISCGVTTAFMEAVEADGFYDLINPRTNQPSGRLKARDVFNKIVEMAWHNGEPGIIFLDRLNEFNPTPHVGEFESTNPCGEQPLLPYESCNLGSINLAKFVTRNSMDWERLRRVIQVAVHFLDNVIDANRYPLPEIEHMTKANRKIGLGVMGFADMLILRGIPYDSEEAIAAAREVMSFIQREARQASIELAKLRGPFPNFKGSIYDDGEIPTLRNATVTTIAPTGTISIIAGCSSGIEPLFAVAYTRNVLDNDQLVEVNPLFEAMAKRFDFYSPELMKLVAKRGSVRGIEDIPEHIQQLFATAHDIVPEYHVKIQAAFQEFTDNAVSKTVNLPNEASQEDVAKAFWEAYRTGCKGITIYRDGSRSGQVLTIKKTEEEQKGGQQGVPKAVVRPRPQVTSGRTLRIPTAHGNMYVTINEDEYGICEVFAQTGKSGGDAAANNEAIARLISMALRAGVPVEDVIKQLRGIRSSTPVWFNGGLVLSGPDGIAIALERYIHWRKTGQELDSVTTAVDAAAPAGECPDCGSTLKYEEGCSNCPQCGYSRCS